MKSPVPRAFSSFWVCTMISRAFDCEMRLKLDSKSEAREGRGEERTISLKSPMLTEVG